MKVKFIDTIKFRDGKVYMRGTEVEFSELTGNAKAEVEHQVKNYPLGQRTVEFVETPSPVEVPVSVKPEETPNLNNIEEEPVVSDIPIRVREVAKNANKV